VVKRWYIPLNFASLRLSRLCVNQRNAKTRKARKNENPRVVSIAKEFGVVGSVQNLADGRVKITAECDEEVLERFLDAIRIKNTLINVHNVLVEYSDATGDYAAFYKLVGEGETDERLDKASEYLKDMIVIMKTGFEDMRTGFKDMQTGFGEMKEEMKTGFGDVKEEISGVKEEMKTGFGEMKEEMKTGFGEMKEEMKTGFGDVKEEISGVREDISGVKEEITEMKEEMKTGFETLGSKGDQTIGEIKYMRGDLNSYMDWKLKKVGEELEEKFAPRFDEIQRVLIAHGMMNEPEQFKVGAEE